MVMTTETTKHIDNLAALKAVDPAPPTDDEKNDAALPDPDLPQDDDENVRNHEVPTDEDDD